METRTIFVVGTAIVAGLSVDFLPDLFAQLAAQPACHHRIAAVLCDRGGGWAEHDLSHRHHPQQFADL